MSAEGSTDRPEQLWLDVERPIHLAPPRARRNRRVMAAQAEPVRQAALCLEAPAAVVVALVAYDSSETQYEPVVAPPERPSFGAWLLDQGSRRGFIGDLAKAARLDRLFPRGGDAGDVRARFSLVGADGDVFEALDDAEREHARHYA